MKAGDFSLIKLFFACSILLGMVPHYRNHLKLLPQDPYPYLFFLFYEKLFA